MSQPSCIHPPASVELLTSDGGLHIVNKRGGLPSTGRTLDDPECARFQLQRQLGTRVWAVHQLDKLTSGLLVCVSKKSLVGVWADRLGAPATRKTYLALVDGPWERSEPVVVVDVPIGTRRQGRKTFPCAWGDHAKAASSTVRLVSRHGSAALLAVEITTGRTHQVRLHLASLGLPVAGDPLHGKGRTGDAMGLHAWRLDVPPSVLSTFAPTRGTRDVDTSRGLTVEAPIPAALDQHLAQHGLSFSDPSR